MKTKIIIILLCLCPILMAQQSIITESYNGVNIKLVWVEGGTFDMGCTSEQQTYCDDDEQIVRHLTMSGFYMGIFEVTQKQWKTIMGTTISELATTEPLGEGKGNFNDGLNRVVDKFVNIVDDVFDVSSTTKNKISNDNIGADMPIYYVSWFDAMQFCKVLSEKTGKHYALPTEAQWEYAARGGKYHQNTLYSGSNEVDRVAWTNDNANRQLHKVGLLQPNVLGIYDMSGNVSEWCSDLYYDEYDIDKTTNPEEEFRGTYRVNRGGSWLNHYIYSRVAKRNFATPHQRIETIGFRIILIP